MTRRLRPLAALAVLTLFVAACGGDDDAADGAGDQAAAEITGILTIAPGACEADTPTGSWFRMVQSGGTVADGPYVDNPDSSCADSSLTVLAPGSDGGLRVGDHQPQPDPAFLEDGTAAASAIIAPAPFFAVAFGVSTNEVDPQTGESVPAPVATIDGTTLTVDHRALSVSWNGQQFNQGAPSPAGVGDPASGSYDPATGAYTLDWTATVVGGPFNNFTGIWHLEGVLQAS